MHVISFNFFIKGTKEKKLSLKNVRVENVKVGRQSGGKKDKVHREL